MNNIVVVEAFKYRCLDRRCDEGKLLPNGWMDAVRVTLPTGMRRILHSTEEAKALADANGWVLEEQK